ncbi:protein TONNEAU 1a [Canna indica]|uniref:Protein TONNEAU 1a n=1 Tax=Canna indica TaxID=4628 RepID=A0AAQ3K9H7_9LILI|nr:protein TONNEAU 1a [Canna indica]
MPEGHHRLLLLEAYLIWTDRKSGSSASMNRKDEYMWRYNAEVSEDVLRAANALENIHLDRKAWNMATYWRHPNDGLLEDDGTVVHQ